MPETTLAAVSVVIPCYRCVTTIERAVASVAAQTMPPMEVILVEDCSGDDTLEMLYAIERNYQEGWVRVLEQRSNRGPGEARNAGWEVATQPYIAFLDADDTWHPKKIEIQYVWMRSHPEVALTGHGTHQLKDNEIFDEALAIDPRKAEFRPRTKSRLLWANRLSTPTVMLRRELPMRFAHGKYHSEDYLLWLTIACAGKRLARCDLALAYLHKAPYGEAGLSAQLWQMEKGQLDTYARIRKLGCVGPVKYILLVGWSWLRFHKRLMLSIIRVGSSVGSSTR